MYQKPRNVSNESFVFIVESDEISINCSSLVICKIVSGCTIYLKIKVHIILILLLN